MARTTQQLAVAMMIGLLGAARPALAGSADAPHVAGSLQQRRHPGVDRPGGRAVADVPGAGRDDRRQRWDRLCGTGPNAAGGVRACFVAVAEAGPNRLLKVVVDTRKAEWDLMGSIGHELRHTIEILETPRVRTSTQMYFFYEKRKKRDAPFVRNGAAVDAGQSVREEVRKYQRQLDGR